MTLVEEEDITQALMQPDIVAESEPEVPYCHIWATIDENERRIKAEEARYAELVANRSLYDYYMDPYDFKVLMRHASTRLVNFDPAWDLSAEAYPLPRPWEYQRH